MADVLGKILQKIFGSSSERYVKRCAEMVEKINSLGSTFEALTDEQLRAKTEELRRTVEAKKREVFGSRTLDDMLEELNNVPEDRRKTLKRRIIHGLNTCAEAILPEAFAAVRETCRRTWYPSWVPGAEPDGPPPGVKHFDVQLIGGHVLHEGKIAEMATGEGKTLVATLPAYVNVLLGMKVHIVSTNDFLVKTGRDWVLPIYEALGVTVGAIQSDMDTMGDQRKSEYACDVVYGTNNEFGFDYLRDNMKIRHQDQVQGPLHYAIIDEVDSILVDEARTPLIISGPARDDISRYRTADRVARAIVKKQKSAIRDTQSRIRDPQPLRDRAARAGVSDTKVEEAIKKFQQDPTWVTEEEAQAIGHSQYYLVERDRKAVHLTHDGVTAAQEEANIGSFYVGANMEWPHLIENSLRAHVVYERDKEYVVQQGEIIIVDEFTGRLMHGRQWSEGLHQSIEAKEGVRIKEETQTLATVTIQNYFKLYCKLAGMTGTAMTEAEEFMKIYNLDVVTVPTNRPVNRIAHNDRIYRTADEKFKAIVAEIRAVSVQGFPDDPYLIEQMLRALKKVYQSVLAKGDRNGSRWSEKQCREIIDRIDGTVEKYGGNDLNLKKLRDLLIDLVGDLPGGRPVLVGTTSIENSEKLSGMLFRTHGIDHEILNAKHVAHEAEIVAHAGHRHRSNRDHNRFEGNVTISTNMAGRGTDIKLQEGVVYPACIGDLGPKEPGVIGTKCCMYCPEYDGKCDHCFKPKIDPRFPELGRTYCSIEPPCGLHVVGTERHEARRVDNQLRGRSGRQGDPGSSRFFLSLQDDLLRFFAGEWVIKMLGWLGMEEGMAIENKRISKGIERAQKKVEERNFSIRKNLLEYDEVMDYQRQAFYHLRQRIIEGRGLARMIHEIITETIDSAVDNYLDPEYPARCIAEWAGSKLEISIAPGRLELESFADLQDQLKTRAKEDAVSVIEMTIGEYFDADVDRKDWDYRGLARWAMSKFNVNLAISQMTKSQPEEIREMLSDAAVEKIDRFDCTPVQRFLEPTFAKSALAEWARNKFALDVRLADIADLGADGIRELLGQKIDHKYRRREVECPVDITLMLSLGQEGRPETAYGLDHLVRWANLKYQADWTLEFLQNKKDVAEIRSELIKLAENYLTNGQLAAEVEQALGVYQGQALVDWANARFDADLDSRAFEQTEPKTLLLDTGREFLRRELTGLEQMVLVSIYDSAWKEHLLAMDHLKGAIGLRGYAEKDPRIEYKREGTEMFNRMLDSVRDQVSDAVLKVQVSSSMQARSVWQDQQTRHESATAYMGEDAGEGLQGQGAGAPKPIKRDKPKIRPNDPCPCGSGKKYKKCCGRAR